MSDKNQEFSAKEKALLSSFHRKRKPPAQLENNVVKMLTERGMILPTRLRFATTVPRIAIGVAVLILGFLMGVWYTSPSVSETDSPLFVLLLYEFETQPKAEAELVDEYRRWARRMAQAGHLLGGEKLRNDGRLLQRSAAGLQIQKIRAADKQQALTGYFLIRANNYEQAEKVAGTCPHLNYGGAIELRAIEKT